MSLTQGYRTALHPLCARVIAIGLLLANCISVPGALAGSAEQCWAGFFRDQGIAGVPPELVAVPLGGRVFRIPAAYAWHPTPPSGTADSIWLMAWLPSFAPVPPEEIVPALRSPNFLPSIRITVFGDGRMLTGQALLDAHLRDQSYASRGERDTLGWPVLRTDHRASMWAEIHVAPGAAPLVHCSLDPIDRGPPAPLCRAVRPIGGPLRLHAEFRKASLPDYAAIDHALTRMACCMLDPDPAQEQSWPERDCRRPG